MPDEVLGKELSGYRYKRAKEGVFESKISDIIRAAFVVRNASDYDDMYIAEKTETVKQIKTYGLASFLSVILIVRK